MTTDLQNLGELLKIYYRDFIADSTEVGTVGYAIFEKNKEDVDGLEAKFAVRLRKNWGLLSQQRLSRDLPDTRNMSLKQPTLSLVRHTGRLIIDNALIHSSKGKEGAFAQALDLDMKDIMESLMLDAGRQLYGDSLGIQAHITAAAAAGAPATITVHSTQYIYEGAPFVVYTSAGVFVGAADIISVLSETEFTATTTFAVAPTDQIYFGFSAIKNNSQFLIPGTSQEILGLRAAIGNVSTFPTYLGVSRAAYSRWNSFVKNDSFSLFTAPGNAPLSESAMIEVYNGVKKNTSLSAQGQAALKFVIITSFEAQQAYFNGLVGDRQYTVPNQAKTISLPGGYEGLQFMDGTAVVGDKLCPVEYDPGSANGIADNMFFVNKETFQWYVWKWYDFDDTDGNILARRPDEDAYEARIQAYLQLGCDNPIKSGRYIFIR